MNELIFFALMAKAEEVVDKISELDDFPELKQEILGVISDYLRKLLGLDA